MKNYEEMAERVFKRIEEYEIRKKKRQKAAVKAAVTLTSLALIVILGLAVWKGGSLVQKPVENSSSHTAKEQGDGSSEGDSETLGDKDRVYIPKMNVTLGMEEGFAADMIGFFIYDDRCYVEYIELERTDMIGDYLGSSQGLIDEWTKEDGYVNFAGSVAGDFYEVKGFSPEFMLCMKWEEDSIMLYMNNNGFGMNWGRDLYEDRLQMSGHIKEVSYLSREDWYYETKEPVKLEESMVTQVENFVSLMNEAAFLYTEDIPCEKSNLYEEKEQYHLYLTLENGFLVHLRLFEDGYVMLDGLHSVCVKVDTSEYEKFKTNLK